MVFFTRLLSHIAYDEGNAHPPKAAAVLLFSFMQQRNIEGEYNFKIEIINVWSNKIVSIQ